MKLKKIKIENFKSIENIEFDIQKYGDSYTTMLVGINESGKSNVLEAISFLEVDEYKELDLETTRNKKSKKEEGTGMYFYLDFNDGTLINDIKGDVVGIKLLKLKIENIYKKIYLNWNGLSQSISFDIPYIPKNLFIKQETKEDVLGDKVAVITIVKSGDAVLKALEAFEAFEDFETLALTEETFEALTKETFEKYLKPKIDRAIEKYIPTVSFWTPSDKYSLSSVDLNTFKEDIESNIPLKNIFILAGYKEIDIRPEINSIYRSTKKNELMSKLTEGINDYIKNIWEHNIGIVIDITEAGIFSLLLKDEGVKNKHHMYEINQRSDGAKHFLSLMLSLSIEAHNKVRKNQLILIDEPEMHLHPSAIRDLRKELLKIGKCNYLFAATHSPFLIDKKHKERNIIIKKNDNACTEIHRIKEHEDILDDEVLKEAFGMEVYRDLLNPHSLLVEGKSDKKILQKAFSLMDIKCSITNGHGGTIKSIASKLNRDDIPILVVVDDDKDGKAYKKDILGIGGVYSKKQVFTIRDLVGNIKAEGTIEDTLSKEFIESEFNKFIKSKRFKSKAITLKEDTPFMKQIKGYINKFSEKDTQKENLKIYLPELKTQLVASFELIKTSLLEKHPLLHGLVEEIKNKLENIE